MAQPTVFTELEDRLNSGHVLFHLKTIEEARWREELGEFCEAANYTLKEWSLADAVITVPDERLRDTSHLEQFLSSADQAPDRTLFLMLPPFEQALGPLAIRRLKEFAQTCVAKQQGFLFLSDGFDIPSLLAPDFTSFELPLPALSTLDTTLETMLNSSEHLRISIEPEQKERVIHAVLGLTRDQAQRAWQKVFHDQNQFSEEMLIRLVAEKKHLLSGSNMLEFHDLAENMNDVGGLDGLKDWLRQRGKAFSADAQAKGIAQPKGVLLLGVQGCGKSLTARVIAHQLGFPLVRFDFSRLLESARGGSERNLDEVLQTMATMAPAVLWIEELDKAFAGLKGAGDQDTAVQRMFGRFLTWMQEHTEPVFVVATANSVEHLPPELLRRGRFDELFFIDLPNFDERKQIFTVHLSRKQQELSNFDLEELSEETEGFSGAEIEQIISAALIESYTRDRGLEMGDLLAARKATVPLSKTLEDDIFTLREWARTRCRPATADSRVKQMLEEEQRKGIAEILEGESQKEKWHQLATSGNYRESLVAYVKFHTDAFFSRLQQTYAEFMETQGEQALVLASDENVALWTGMSEDFADVIHKVLNGKRLFVHSVDVAEYQNLREVLAIPVLARLREKPLPKLVWFPSVLRTVPPKEGSGRLGKLMLRTIPAPKTVPASKSVS